jgi:DNA repair protein RecN (Recombination protein N)
MTNTTMTPNTLTITRLSIHDFVLVERLDLDLRGGLNVLSGGSGEGKTLIVRALEFLFAGQPYGRASAARWVRQGAAEARVEARVEGATPALLAALREAGVARPDGGALVISRALDRAGRSRCEAGGQALPLPALRAVGQALVEVFGQGEAAGLTNDGRQRALLDAAASSSASARDYAQARGRALDLARERDAVAADEARLREDGARARDDRAALDALAPEPGEYEALVEEGERLGERELELQQLGATVALLDDDEGAACDRLRQALARLGRVEDAKLDPAREAIEQALSLATDAAGAVRRAQEQAELDGERVEAVRERLASFRALARRLRLAPEALAARRSALSGGDDPEALAERRERLDASLAASRPDLDRRRDALAAARREAAPRLVRAIERLLPDLGLEGARFEAIVDDLVAPAASPGEPVERALLREHPAPSGRDRVTFLFAAGPTQPLGPLERASGGELARLFLALALETAGEGEVPLLVFDEVDQNVGARLGAAVGRCLAGIGGGRQVLAITHLATVAARADHHVRILKTDGRTHAQRLEGEARVDELALMIKGLPVTDAARAQARELLREATPAEQSARPTKRPKGGKRPRADKRRPVAL